MRKLIAVGTMGPKLKNRFAYDARPRPDWLDTALNHVVAWMLMISGFLAFLIIASQLDHWIQKHIGG